jgi:NAD(P)-dependent dehydrogenase (short-subunit alcohol dehydrogenase family)
MIQETIYITGAASGIGQEIARRYARSGANLALFDLSFNRDAKALIESQRHNSSQGIAYFDVDVTDLEGLVSQMAIASEQVGLPSLALNCAGINRTGLFEDVAAEEFEKVVSVNLFGSRNFVQASIPLLKKNKAASKLVFIASMAGLVGTFAYTSYNASKFGVVGLAQALRTELAPEGLVVQVVCPPEVDTPMVHEEHKTIHPVTLKLKLIAGALTLEHAVDDIMKGLKSKRFYIIPGKLARLTYWINRLLPLAWVNKYIDTIVKKVLSQQKR